MFMTSTLPKKHRTTGLIKPVLWLAAFLFLGCSGFAQQRTPQFLEKVTQGAVLLADESGRVILNHQEDQPFPPASTVKILTSEIAIQALGLDYQPNTEFYLGPQGQLGIKGFGDPYLISEEIALIAVRLKKLGLRRFSGIQLDRSQFKTSAKAPGTTNTLNPYDALNGALAVNFNSLFLRRDQSGKVYSAESVTPLTPLAQTKGNQLKPGTADRFNLTNKPGESILYVAQLFQKILNREGLPTGSDFRFAPLSSEFKLLFIHQNSRDLSTMLTGLLKYSNNYIANQLLFILGAEVYGWPAEEAKSLKYLNQQIIKQFNPDPEKFQLKEGSGISRSNHMTASMMLKVLTQFKPHYALLHRHRKIKAAYLKSGTLTGVYNYAGYFKTKKGLRPFVIFLSQKTNRRDELLRDLYLFSTSH